MSTTNPIITRTYGLITTGPINATFSFKKDGVGEYAVNTSDTPPEEDIFGQYVGLQPVSLALAAGERLHIRGEGIFAIITTPVA